MGGVKERGADGEERRAKGRGLRADGIERRAKGEGRRAKGKGLRKLRGETWGVMEQIGDLDVWRRSHAPSLCFGGQSEAMLGEGVNSIW